MSAIDQAKKASIRDFVASLSVGEYIFMLNEGRKREKDRSKIWASFVDLPFEIIGLVIPHLRLEDILNCRLVSRGWWAIFNHDDMANRLCSYFFPVLKSLNEKPDQRLFLGATRRLLRRRVNNFKHRVFLRWDADWRTSVFHNEDSLSRPRGLRSYEHCKPSNVVYKDGKLAWQDDENGVHFGDLHTFKRYYCEFDGMEARGQQMKLSAVTKDLIVVIDREETAVGSSRGPRHIINVWHITEQRWQCLFIPEYWSCFAEGERVAFLTSNCRLIIWSWGSQSRAIDAVSSESLTLSLEGLIPSSETLTAQRQESFKHDLKGIIWHPSNKSIFYSVWTSTITGNVDKPKLSILVIKYDGDREVERFCETGKKICFSCGTALHQAEWPVPLGQATDPYGSRLVGCVTCYHGKFSLVVSISFNVFTETFNRRLFVGTVCQDSEPGCCLETPPSDEFHNSGVAWEEHLISGSGKWDRDWDDMCSSRCGHGYEEIFTVTTAIWYQQPGPQFPKCTSKIDVDEYREDVDQFREDVKWIIRNHHYEHCYERRDETKDAGIAGEGTKRKAIEIE
ncbi:hypothetical protein CDD80_2554 [Ophiocordyceps camponoti-rufipedis]|uniref:F-box domain-containing protein n=1 Tax=Ophiocordyceps camponoti-rufipedis TaxID=2004952 RepID=A0A2C5ZK13_9HYPO|nr:hypothetical protein CDD80_2554 [Ophiocordyceps camponoti-rufipedis]